VGALGREAEGWRCSSTLEGGFIAHSDPALTARTNGKLLGNILSCQDSANEVYSGETLCREFLDDRHRNNRMYTSFFCLARPRQRTTQAESSLRGNKVKHALRFILISHASCRSDDEQNGLEKWSGLDSDWLSKMAQILRNIPTLYWECTQSWRV